MGRRLAFDENAGRLWVVCGTCERWNLSPLETRWEAIEEAERAFRATKLRVQTDNIGLAQLSDGLELVRIGKPLQQEFAAWRYGDQFGKRSRRATITATAGGLVGLVPLGLTAAQVMHASVGAAGALGFMAGGMVISHSSMAIQQINRWKEKYIPKLAVRDDNGTLLQLTHDNASSAKLSARPTGNEWKLRLAHAEVIAPKRIARIMKLTEQASKTPKFVDLTGDTALRALATIMPQVNLHGANKKRVREAVDVVQQTKDVDQLMRDASGTTERYQIYRNTQTGEIRLNVLPAPIRLALEMSLHEDDERRAMEGELQELEQRWRDADAIAKIADGLLLPTSINEQLQTLQARNIHNDQVASASHERNDD